MNSRPMSPSPLRTLLAISLAAFVTMPAIAQPTETPTAPSTPQPSEDAPNPTAPNAPTADPELRIGVVYGPRSGPEYENRPSPLFYGGGFLTKTPVFETLVGMDRHGAPTAGLATAWSVSPDGLVYTLTLRPGAVFHDGRRCDADAVVAHFARLGGVEDRFIGAFDHLVAIEAQDARTVRFELDRPYPLLEDLTLVNPMSIVVADAPRDAEPAVLIGTGPFVFESFEPMRRAVYRRFDAYDATKPQIESFSYEIYPSSVRPDGVLTWALERGHVDAIVEGWTPAIPRGEARMLARDPRRFRLVRTPGSAVVTLVFRSDRAPFDDVASRRFVAGTVDRGALVDIAEHGFAEEARTIFAPGVADWPMEASDASSTVSASDVPPAGLVERELTLLVSGRDVGLLVAAFEIARQLEHRGIPIRVERQLPGTAGYDRVNRLGYDLLLTRTWGLPYDPHASLVSRLAPNPDFKTAVETLPFYTHPELTRRITDSFDLAPGSNERRACYRSIQQFVDEQAAVVPLYIPNRIAITTVRVRGLELGPHGYGLDLSRVTVEPPR